MVVLVCFVSIILLSYWNIKVTFHSRSLARSPVSSHHGTLSSMAWNYMCFYVPQEHENWPGFLVHDGNHHDTPPFPKSCWTGPLPTLRQHFSGQSVVILPHNPALWLQGCHNGALILSASQEAQREKAATPYLECYVYE